MLIHFKVFNKTFSYISKQLHFKSKSNTLKYFHSSYHITNDIQLSGTLQISG